MNKYQFKKWLKDVIDARGLDFINQEGNESLKKQWDSREATDDMYNDLYKFYDLDTEMEAIDPRRFKTWLLDASEYNDPQTKLWGLKKYEENESGTPLVSTSGEDLYPHQFFGDVKEESFYNPNAKEYWANLLTPYTLKNQDGSVTRDISKGLFKVLNDQDMTQQELLKLITEEQTRRDRERAANLRLKENYDGLGSGDGALDRAWRGLNAFGIEHFFPNTLRDIKDGTANGVNPIDAVGATGDVLLTLTPGGLGVKSFGKQALGYIGEAAMPFVKEGLRSNYYGEKGEWDKAFEDAKSNVIGRGIGDGIRSPFNSLKKIPLGDEWKKSIDVFTKEHPKTTNVFESIGKGAEQLEKLNTRISKVSNEVDPKTLGNTEDDYEKAAEVYNNLMKEKPEAVMNATKYRGGGEDLTDTERDWIDKYLLLNLDYGKR